MESRICGTQQEVGHYQSAQASRWRGLGLGWAKRPQCRRDDPFPCRFLWGPVKRQECLPPPGWGGSARRPGCGKCCSVLREAQSRVQQERAALLLAVSEDSEAEGTDPSLPKRAFPRGDRQRTGTPSHRSELMFKCHCAFRGNTTLREGAMQELASEKIQLHEQDQDLKQHKENSQ